MGRNKRTEQIKVRFTKAERRRLEAEAKQQDVPLAELLRRRILKG